MTGACSVTTDLIMRVNVRTATTASLAEITTCRLTLHGSMIPSAVVNGLNSCKPYIVFLEDGN